MFERRIQSAEVLVVGQFDFHRSIEKTSAPAQVMTSQKTKRLKNGRRLSGNTSSLVAATSSPPLCLAKISYTRKMSDLAKS